MANIVVVGQKAANQAFNPAIQQAQAQVPAINTLYSTLLQGLQNQGQSQLQNVLTSADQRGVMRASQPASTQQALDTSLMQAGAQLGAQQAQNVAGIGGVVGQGQAQRALSAQQLVEGLTAADIAARENKLKLTDINRADELNTIRNQVAEAKAAARAAASASKADAKLPTLKQRKDGGFSFTNYYGEPISAADFAKQAKVPFDAVLKEMAMKGDKGALDVLTNGSNSKYYDDFTYTGRWDAKKSGW